MIVILIFVVLGVASAGAVEIRVPDDYPSIQEGINAASNGDTILVADGTYAGNLDFGGRLITVKSENDATTTVIDCGGSTRGVSFVSGETPSAVLRGFTITNARVTGSAYGAGINIVNASPTIEECIFESNVAERQFYGGGGIFVRSGAPIIRHCQFRNNKAYAGAGIAAVAGANVTVTNCLFESNEAISTTPISEWGQGGGIYGQASHFTVERCTFLNNEAKQGAGLFASSSGSQTVNASKFIDNKATERGGGLSYPNCDSVITSVLFAGNTADFSGGAVDINQGMADFTHCTFTDNIADADGTDDDWGGGIGLRNSAWSTITNSILWGDAPDEIHLATGSTVVVTYSDVQGGWPGDGNIDDPPLFVDAENNDYHLLPGSPCIGKGDPDSDIPYDIEGNPRPAPADTPPDMGAYESPLGPNSPPVLVVDNPIVSVTEGSVAINTGSVFDPDGDEVNLSQEPIGAIAPTTILGSGNFTWTYTSEEGPATQEVTITADDNVNNPVDETFTLEVLNVAPTVGDILAPIEPVEVETPVIATASFTDPGTADTHTATWDWGDESTSEGVVDEANGSGTVTGTHTYTTPGVYTLTLTVTDDDGGSGESAYQFVVVYDPDGGFVTGGGWIQSPPGAYADDPDLTGKANFGFVSKYKKGASTPTGQTEFNFKVADLDFHSSSYEWLVIAGAKAKYKGDGTINGEGNYGFMLTATDADLTPSTPTDLFRIKIWDKDDGDAVVYDNKMGAGDDSYDGTEIGGGNIKVHKAKNAAPAKPTLALSATEGVQTGVPLKTQLLRNFPNPFNPETWFAYELATDADVTLRIYSTQGQPVRQLDLGHQSAGYYVDRDAAAYWDGRNNSGEAVTSGLYFYTFQAGDFLTTRKLLVTR